MRITIDTQSDSKDEIRKAIKLLLSLAGEGSVYSNEPSGTRNIFDSSSPTVPMTESQSAPAQPSGSIFGNLFDADKQEQTMPEKKDNPKIEFY